MCRQYLSLFVPVQVVVKVGRYFFGQVMSPKLSDHILQRSQVFGVALCMSKVKVPSVSQWVTQWMSEWQGHLLSCSGQLKTNMHLFLSDKKSLDHGTRMSTSPNSSRSRKTTICQENHFLAPVTHLISAMVVEMKGKAFFSFFSCASISKVTLCH